MEWEGKKVLVTGSAGVIGRVLIERLVQRGAKVLCVDIASSKVGSVVQHIQADLSKGIPTPIRVFDPEVVFHLAATFERTEELPGYWETSFDNNVLLSHMLLCALTPCTRLEVFVFASSYLTYSSQQYLKVPQIHFLRETDPIAPRNLVGLAKYFTEMELGFLSKMGAQFRSASARIFRVYGRGSRDIISRWIRCALQGEAIEVYGENGRFDYIYADDVAEGLIKLSEFDAAKSVVNLGSGVARSINDVVAILRTEFNDLQVKHLQSDGPIEASCADMTLFKQITGWMPRTSLEHGIQQIIAYEKSRHGLQ